MTTPTREPFDETPLEHALTYSECGLRVLPIKPGEKRPPMSAWQDAATTDRDTIHKWWKGKYRDCGVGLALGLQPDGRMIFALDVDEHDPAASGSEALAELEARHGKLPDTVRAITAGGGVHLLFSAPCEVTNGAGSIAPGLDVRGQGGQIAVAPTPHPTLACKQCVAEMPHELADYQWEHGYAPWEHDIAPAPEWLLQLVAPPEPQPSQPTSERAPSGHTSADGDSPADWLREGWDWTAELTSAGWTLHHTDRNGDTQWTRPGKDRREGASGTLHGTDGPFVVWSTDAGLEPLWRLGRSAGGSGVSVTPLDFRAYTDHGGDISAASRAVRAAMPRPEAPDPSIIAGVVFEGAGIDTRTPPPNVDPLTGEVKRVDSWRNLPDEFWSARPELEHIRDAAHARSRSADAVLLFTLARMCATIPSAVRLPPIVGGPASLNFLGAVIGTSGSGKSSAGAVARELVQIDRKDVVADLPLGSGEGLVEQFFEYVPEEQANGKDKLVKRKTRDGLYMYLDEGQALGEMGSRKGATLLPTLRAAWSGETIGQTNASVETHRVVHAHTYRMALVVGFQAEHAHGLLDDAAGGTPQRFVFASAVDPAIPDEDVDDDESYEWLEPIEPLKLWLPRLSGTFTNVSVDRAIAKEVRARNRAATRGAIEIAGLDSHRDLVRLKVAALLGFLDGRLCVEPDDWALAELVMRASRAVRTWVAELARTAALAVEVASHKRAAAREIVVANEVEQRALDSAARSVARRVRKSSAPIERREITQSIAGKHRQIVSVDEVIAEAERLKWIKPNGALGWVRGEAAPT